MKKYYLLFIASFALWIPQLLEAQIPTPEECRFNRGNWVRKTSMPEGRAMMASSIIDGKIYATCGYYSYDLGSGQGWESEYKCTLFCYDPVADTWDSSRTPIPVPRAYSSGQAVVDGKWYVAGGMQWEKISAGNWMSTPLARVDVYDPQTDSWELRANLPEPIGGAGIVSLDGKIYVTGGGRTLESDPQLYNSLYMYDPELDEWETRADMNSARCLHCTVSYNGKIYVFGGDATGKAAEVYDPEQDQWTTIASSPYYADRAGGCVLNNEIYLFGGTWNLSSGPVYSRMILKYNPEQDAWSNYGTMPDGMFQQTAGAVGEKVYLIGGERVGSALELSAGAVDEFEISKIALEEILPDTTVEKGLEISLDLSQYFIHQLGQQITFTVCTSQDGVVSESMDGSTLVLHGLEADSIRVFIRAESGNDAFGTQFSVKVDPSVGVSNQETVLDAIQIFPNPAGNLLTVQLQKKGPHNYLIYSASGQQVMEGILTGSTQPIDLSILDKGMYFIKVSSPELDVTRKFLKIW